MRLLFIVMIEGIAVLWDFYDRRIPNTLIMCGFFLGLSWQWCDSQFQGILNFLFGVSTILLLLFILHWFRMLGAGDIKLFMISGGFLGPKSGVRTIILSFLIAAGISVAILIRHHILKRRLIYFFHYIQDLFATGIWRPYIDGSEDEAYLHFSLPVFLGTLIVAGGYL